LLYQVADLLSDALHPRLKAIEPALKAADFLKAEPHLGLEAVVPGVNAQQIGFEALEPRAHLALYRVQTRND
jgi:hypothetical protein